MKAPPCQATCKPPCDRESSSPVEHRGKPLRICSGHNMRWRRATTDQERDEALSTPLRPAGAGVKFGPVVISRELDAQLRAAAAEDGVSVSDLNRDALELWLEHRARRRGK